MQFAGDKMKSSENVEAQHRSWAVSVSMRALRSSAVAVIAASASACWAEAKPAGLDAAALQNEADYRVVAARCGKPAFEKAFFVSSQQFVAASNDRDRQATARQESAIRSMRRNPITLIGSQSDCKAQGAILQRLMVDRSKGRERVSSR